MKIKEMIEKLQQFENQNAEVILAFEGGVDSTNYDFTGDDTSLGNYIDIITDGYNISNKKADKILEILEEIDGITITADSPDSNKLIKENPKQACENMMADLTAISGLIDNIKELF